MHPKKSELIRSIYRTTYPDCATSAARKLPISIAMKTMSAQVFDGSHTRRRWTPMSGQKLRSTWRLALLISLCWSYYAIAEDQPTVEIASSEAPVLTSCQPDQAGIALQRPGKAAIQYDESANCERKLVEPFSDALRTARRYLTAGESCKRSGMKSKS